MAITMAIFAIWYVEHLEDPKRGKFVEDPETSGSGDGCEMDDSVQHGRQVREQHDQHWK
ncbi:hypothetical protein CH063_07706 [Colletotrichum higginsianum]|nr:hypothetical protein CH063_07706 [Colletotrichum higginsianum]